MAKFQLSNEQNSLSILFKSYREKPPKVPKKEFGRQSSSRSLNASINAVKKNVWICCNDTFCDTRSMYSRAMIEQTIPVDSGCPQS
jgi:hypothetical protein